MSSDCLKDVPEFFEVDLGESILARTEALTSFRELGPPDLCHITKTTGRSGGKDIGSYHYVSGIDASSSASLAAYINSLTYSLEETPGWFGGKGKSEWKVKHGVYCAYNAFSRVDVRVEVKIPGGVEAYIVDSRGERHPPSPAIWTEVYLTSALRAILYADDPNYKIAGFRKLDPIKTLEDEVRFVSAAEQCYSKGWSLGSDPEIQVATNISNHLTSGIMKYFGDSNRYGPAVNLFEKLLVRDGEIASLLASAYIGMDEEVKAVQVLHRAIQEHPQSYPLLHVQADFLRKKPEWAFKLARQAVNCAPSEFVTWSKLTEVNIELKEYDAALLALNSCPMFTYNERDMHRMPTPSRTHLPVKQFITESGVLPADSGDPSNAEHDQADIALMRLPAPNLKGTWKKAYDLLTQTVAHVGWDELLRTRSEVFVMEEEYRMQKQMQDGVPIVEGEETNGSSHPDNGADDYASTHALRSSTTESHRPQSPSALSQSKQRTHTNGSISPADDPQKQLERSPEPPSSPIPEIRISEHNEDSDEANADVDNELKSSMNGPAPGVDKPATSHVSEAHDAHTDEIAKEAGATADSQNNEQASTPQDQNKQGAVRPSLMNKRLCERWLDNLFMVLYEDLRVYTIWRSEIAHYKSQHLPYRKTPTEWEILGDLAQRLHHRDEAKDAYQRCIEQTVASGTSRFPAKVWQKLLEYYVDEGDVQKSLNAIIRLATYQHRWYQEMAYPTAVARQLYRLIQREGVSKVSYSLVSMNVPQPVLKHCIQPMFHYAQALQIPGSEY
ncbi:chaps-domain-containing protein [Cystobasidium minutum MCA 4210]|uniref:chaps-domain-containing protein n=1 Tax=Cystobasidium minutum MCA 4210 TaxID=1397322 RepID=UPI0034CDDDB8|eukprot:jgi/Rhomi1/7019/CE7018_1469